MAKIRNSNPKTSSGGYERLLGNKDMLSNITNMFTSKKEQSNIKKLQPTEIDIKNYTKVE